MTCENSRRGKSHLSRNRLGQDVFLALVHDPHFFAKAETCIYIDLGVYSLRGLCPDMGSRRSHKRRRKTGHEISQSASQLKILEQKQPALSEHNACRRAVIGPGERVSVSELPFREAVKAGAQTTFRLHSSVIFLFWGKTSTVCWRCK